MDVNDYAAVYGIVGGLTSGVGRYVWKNTPRMDQKEHAKYYALFASTGCLGGVLATVMFPGRDTNTTAFFGGVLGSFLILTIGIYM
jgi:hypothetical protein